MKRFISMILILSLSLLLLPAHAATYTIQDMASFSEGIAVYKEYFDKNTHNQYYFKVNAADMQKFIESYCTMLLGDEALTYLGGVQHGENVYQCFAPASGYSISTFAVKSYGEKLTPDCCIAIQYKLDSSTVYLRCSKELELTDEGFRLSTVNATPTPAPASVPSAPGGVAGVAGAVNNGAPSAPGADGVIATGDCAECEGKGTLGTSGIITCPVCNGTGKAQ